MRAIAIAVAICLMPLMGQAFERLASKEAFLGSVQGRVLTRFGITLQVTPKGAIQGRALGRNVTGSWVWSDGFFCREMAWGSRVFERNCQQVLRQGNTIRFIADRGAGDVADLTLK